MSIVKNIIDELPVEGRVVYCDGEILECERAVFKGGEFIGGSEFPARARTITNVTKWFYLDDYQTSKSAAGECCYSVDFASAELMVD